MFCPISQTCGTYPSEKLEDDDPNVVHVGHIPFFASRAGNQRRDYKSSVYKVTDPDDSEKVIPLRTVENQESVHYSFFFNFNSFMSIMSKGNLTRNYLHSQLSKSRLIIN